jgi:hypothetical protein
MFALNPLLSRLQRAFLELLRFLRECWKQRPHDGAAAAAAGRDPEELPDADDAGAYDGPIPPAYALLLEHALVRQHRFHLVV